MRFSGGQRLPKMQVVDSDDEAPPVDLQVSDSDCDGEAPPVKMHHLPALPSNHLPALLDLARLTGFVQSCVSRLVSASPRCRFAHRL